MRALTLSCATLNQTPFDWDGNTQRIIDAITTAKETGTDVLCLPELCLTGYGCEDQFLSPDLLERALEGLDNILPHTDGITVSVGLPLRHQNAIFNTVALCSNGEILGFYAKQNLAGDGVHYEPRWFYPWPEGKRDTIHLNGNEYFIGDYIWNLDGVRIAFEICEDAWVANRPGSRYCNLGVDLILNPSASHFAFAKQSIREQFVREGSRAYGCAYLYANLVGNESGRMIFGGGSMIANQGNLVAHGAKLSFKDLEITTATVDLELNRLAQARTASRKIDILPEAEVLFDHSWAKNTAPLSASITLESWSKEEEFTKAVSLGLFDYMRKSYTKGFVVSLSGGADSAAVASFVYLMVTLAKKELSATELKKKTSYLGLENFTAEQLLSCVYQATENSGPTTREAASALAKELGAQYDEWEIQSLVEGYESLLSKHLGRELTWEQDDIARQNIQARVRAPGIWMLANLRNALLLTTSNRSEAAVGYATMDGDTCGGLAPIAGIDKAYLRTWLRWLEKEGSARVPTIPALKYINEQQPTAELRPAEQAQTDEGDLMPYPILNQIEKWAIRDKRGPLTVYRLLSLEYPETDSETLKTWVKRFFQLWSRNQWKRERYAPSFHLDDENLDPKTWCRFPILSGGFQEELRELSEISS